MAVSRRPNLFLVGGARCGTTAMHTYLGQHPEIFMSPLKEPNHFCPGFRWARGTRDVMSGVGRDEAAYLRLFEAASSEKWVGESSVAYMRSEASPGLIKDFAPDARILIMLRRPIDVVVSLHNFSVYYGVESHYDLGDAIRGDLAYDAAKQPKHFGPAYLETPLYTDQVQRYFDAFGRDNVQLIIYDDFRRKAEDEYTRTLRFLGVDDTFRPTMQERVNASRQIRSPILHRAYMSVWPTLRPNRVTGLFMRKLRRLNSKRATASRIDPKLERELAARFAPDIERLSVLLDRDLTHWNRFEAD